MLDEMAWDRVSEAVAEVDFYRQDHRLIFRVMTKLVGDSRAFEYLQRSNVV